MTVDYKKLFGMPSQTTIAGRSSSITNSFINGVAPAIEPSAEQVREALEALGMKDGHIECAYCGDACTEWDHLNPLVRDKKPTGYITEIHNLVPSCGKCNQSKGNKPWRQWMVSDAKLSPYTRGVADIYERMRLLDDYEKLFEPTRVDFEALLGKDLWGRYWKAYDELLSLMDQCQMLQDAVADAVRKKHAGDVGASERISCADNEPRAERSCRQATAPVKPSATERDRSAIQEAPGLISDIVRKRLVANVKRLKPDDDVVRQLEREAYCRSTFGVSYPILVPLSPGENASESAKDRNGRNRYWVDPIYIGNERFLVCSQWYDRNRADLLRWLRERGW